jgi:hypothetical protein
MPPPRFPQSEIFKVLLVNHPPIDQPLKVHNALPVFFTKQQHGHLLYFIGLNQSKGFEQLILGAIASPVVLLPASCCSNSGFNSSS